MNSTYPAIFYKEDDGGYSIIFPDLNHLATDGDNLNNAMYMAIDCLAGYLYSLKLEKEEIPEPSDMNNIDIGYFLDDPNYDKSRVFINLISVNVVEYAEKHFNKAVKKTVTIPAWMADMADVKGLKLSKLLQDAIKEKLQLT